MMLKFMKGMSCSRWNPRVLTGCVRVDEAASDAKHSRAAVLALGVELEGPNLGVVVTHPRVERDVAGLGVVGLRLGRKASAGLLHARQDHDLEPSGGRDGLERREAPAGTSENLRS